MTLRLALALAALLAAPLSAQEEATAAPGADADATGDLLLTPEEEDRRRGLFRTMPRRDDDAGAEPVFEDPVYNRPPPAAMPAPGAALMLLDKMTGRTERLELPAGGEVEIAGRLRIDLEACLTPPPDRPADAFAWMEIRDLRDDGPRFSGWMLASSPALNPLDHARYDVWVTGCLPGAGTEAAQADAAD